MAGALDLEIEQGATFSLPMQATNPGGGAMDLTAYTGKMQLRRAKQATEVVAELSNANGRVTFPNPGQGQILLTLPAAITAALPGGVPLVYDFVITRSDGYALRLLEGKITVDGGVTRG